MGVVRSGTLQLKPKVKVVFASGTDDLNARLIERMQNIFPGLPLCVVSEFPPADRSVRWVRYQVDRPLRHNLARCRAAFRGSSIRLAAVMLAPDVPLRRLRLLALLLAPHNLLAFNENLNNFMLRPRCIPAIVQHGLWRAGNFFRWHFGGGKRAFAEEHAGQLETETAVSAPEPEVRIFQGHRHAAKPRILIASPYVPFPLSHGGAVRIYNLMRRAAESFDQILVAFTETDDPPPTELLDICTQVTLVRRTGSHLHPTSGRPETVEEFDSPVFRVALRQAVQQWQPQIAQLEFTQMAQYAEDCAPARTILVEHDVTFDLYSQLLALGEDWDLRQQLKLWRSFETAAWRNVDCVVAMSQRDKAVIVGAPASALPNGVDLERFQPSRRAPEPGRLLFIGSFAHLPNLLAAEFFVNDVWPKLGGGRLHIIAGARHEYHLERSQIKLDLNRAGIEVEGFVTDVRPAYARAAVVIAPLRASAGTNIKILEAMAMGKAIVSTRAGVNGLDLKRGEHFVLAETAREFARAVEALLEDPAECARLGAAARRRVERDFNWDVIGLLQAKLYRELLASKSPLEVCARS
jgi:glycosyltransferase involved in cell wall biosynthesis